MKKINKITIIGVGLIGGSIGLALRSKGRAPKIVGVGRRRSSIKKALDLKAIDEGTLNIEDGVEGADIVILATPILSMKKLSKKMAPYLKDGCIVTDVGSAKKRLIGEMKGILPDRVSFVGGHPMAGSEKKGVDIARRDLFKNSVCFLTDMKSTDKVSLRIIKDMWKSMGASVMVLSPDIHDKMVSEISHLPHMVVFSMLMNIDEKSLKFASTGFYDATRIASSDPNLWKDIAISNKEEILKSISNFKKSLLVLERAIKKERSALLLRTFKRAKERRDVALRNRTKL